MLARLYTHSLDSSKLVKQEVGAEVEAHLKRWRRPEAGLCHIKTRGTDLTRVLLRSAQHESEPNAVPVYDPCPAFAFYVRQCLVACTRLARDVTASCRWKRY